MGRRGLPSAARLRAALLATSVGATILALALLFAYLPHVIDLTPSQARALLLAGALAALPLLVLPAWAQQRRAAHIARWLEATHTEVETRRAAFRAAIDLPRFAFASQLAAWPLAGAAAAGALFAGDPSVGLNAPAMIASSALVAGFLAQMFVFAASEAWLEPVRDALAAEIPDPGERAALARPISLATRLLVALAGFTLVTAFFTLSLAAGHAADVIEGLLVSMQRPALERLARFAGTPEGEAAFAAARDAYAPLGVSLVEIGRDALAAESDPSGTLQPHEMRFLRDTLARSDDPAEFQSVALYSPHVFAWTRSGPRGAVLLAITPIDIASLTRGLGLLLGLLSLIAIGTAIATAALAARGLRRGVGLLRGNLQRIAAGDLERGEAFESADELGELGRVLDATAASLRGTIGHVVAASDAVERAAGAVASVSEHVARASADQVGGIQDVARSMERIHSQVTGIAGSAETLSSSVADSSSSVQELEALGQVLHRSASELAVRADEASGSSEQMARSARQVAESTDLLVQQVADVAHHTEALAGSAAQVDRSAGDAAELAARMRERSEQGRVRVRQTIEGIDAIRAATDEAEGVIGGLGQRASRIGSVVSVIDALADDTHLLALNAAIIAAQAGDDGRAFAVVAGEVRELAHRVLASTHEITQTVGAVEREARDAVTAMTRGSARVRSGIERSNEAGASLAEITAAARESGDHVAAIAEAARRQAAATAVVLERIAQALAGIERIQEAGREQAKGSELALENAVVVGEVARRVERSAEGQVESVGAIARAVEQVREALDQIQRGLREQSDASREVAGSLEEIAARTRSNQQSAEGLRGAARELEAQAGAMRQAIARFRLE